MFSQKRKIGLATALLLIAASQARATLILDTSVTGTFNHHDTTTGTAGNDLPLPRPSTLYFGQLGATANGFVDFYYVGNEAAYTNTMVFDSTTYSTASRPDNFNAPHPLITTLSVTAGELLGFGFCTSGGNNVGDFGRCAFNDNAESLTAQYNYNRMRGYRSIGFAGLNSYDPTTGSRTFSSPLNPGTSLSWMIFWDDSGAQNDDNHDDMIAVATFRPLPTTRVAEPGTLGLVSLGLAALALGRRRQSAAAARR